MMRYLALLWQALVDQVVNMGWYFVLAVMLAALIKTYKLDKKIRYFLEKAGPFSIPLAVFTGLISPLCSCGILPVAASLMVAGVPAAPVMALLITSPVMSPDAFVLTLGVLGPAMAWGKLIAAAAFGLAMGYLVQVMTLRRWLPEQTLSKAMADIEHRCVNPEDADDPRRGITVPIGRLRYFGLMVKDMSWLIGRFLVLAMILEAVMVAFVDPDMVRFLIGRSSIVSPLLGVGLGIPLPLQQIAAVPIIKGLLELGANPGAAMALLMAGPVTSIPAISFLSTMVSQRLLWLYLAVGVAGSLVAGFIFIF